MNYIKDIKEILNEFKRYSGLAVNSDKTEIMPLGTSDATNEKLKELGHKIVTEVTITGVVFTYDHNILINKNYRGTLINIDKTLQMWSSRNLSLIGKIQIIKTYGISKIIFITNMKNTPAKIIQEANKILHKFLWNGPDKIKRLTMIADISNGGLKMPHLESIIETQKVMWMKRYSENNDHPWKEFMRQSLKETGSTDIYIIVKYPKLS